MVILGTPEGLKSFCNERRNEMPAKIRDWISRADVWIVWFANARGRLFLKVPKGVWNFWNFSIGVAKRNELSKGLCLAWYRQISIVSVMLYIGITLKWTAGISECLYSVVVFFVCVCEQVLKWMEVYYLEIFGGNEAVGWRIFDMEASFWRVMWY